MTNLISSADNSLGSSRLLTPQEAAKHLGTKAATLASWRSNKRYPLVYVRVGRLIRYRASDLEQFLRSRTHDAG